MSVHVLLVCCSIHSRSKTHFPPKIINSMLCNSAVFKTADLDTHTTQVMLNMFVKRVVCFQCSSSSCAFVCFDYSCTGAGVTV
jgi:hypothetical protein